MGARPLRLGGVPEHFNLPWHQAIADPALSDLALSWEDQLGGTGQMLSALEAGKLDVVSILTEGTVAAIGNGASLTILQVYVASPLQWGVFVPGGSAIEREADLAGARIAVSRFRSGSHLMAFVQAERFGWAITDDQFVVVGGLEGAVSAFGSGEADLFLWERHMTRPLVESGQFREVGILETPWPSFVIAVRDEVLTGRTAEVGRVVDAVVAKAAALHRADATVTELGERYGLDAETVASWLASTRFAPRQAMDPALSAKVMAMLTNAGVV